jgi:glycosyltransferase involved in cell wall biosynthesis
LTTPAFSAVIPAYNAEATLRSAAESVLGQTNDDLELIIVDDGSTDATPAVAAELVRSDPRVRVIRQENQGLAGARNVGIEQSRAAYIAFLDSDDLWMPTFLQRMGGALADDPDAGFAYTDGWVLDDETNRIRRTSVMARQRPPVPPPREPEEFLFELAQRNFIPAEAMVRRTALEGVGVFEPTLKAVEDYDLWLRMLAAGYRGVRPPGLLFVRRDMPGSMSKDLRLMYGALSEVLRRVEARQDLPENVRAVVQRRLEALDRLMSMSDGHRPVRAAVQRAASGLGSLRRTLLRRRLWHRLPPSEVASAFPELWSR